MNQIRPYRFFSFLLSLALLISPLPLSAMIEDIIIDKSEFKVAYELPHSQYIYLGKELSNIAAVISEISNLDPHINSPLSAFKKQVEQGYSLAQVDDIAYILEYAEKILHQYHSPLNQIKKQQLLFDFEDIAQKFIDGSLIINSHDYFDKNAKRTFVNIIQVLGLLSVNDQLVQNITAVDLSVVDEIVQNSTITSLSATDAIIGNATITTLSVTDQVIGNIDVTNISVVDITVTGTLSANDAVIDNTLQFTDSGSNYVGFQAPTTVTSSYTLTLPSATPTGNQLLRANSGTPTTLEWATDGSFAVPTDSKTIYVTKYGNDTTGNGSFATPYLTLSKAITTANSLPLVNPIAIVISSGIYFENNSGGPLAVTRDGISIVGESASSVIVMPVDDTQDLLTVGNTIRISNMTFASTAPSATGINLTAGELTVLSNIRVSNFLNGIICSGGATETYGFIACFFVDNGTALTVSNTRVESNNCSIFGTSTLSGPAANTGLSITGSGSSVVFSGGVIGLCSTGINATTNSFTTVTGVNFRLNDVDIDQSGSSRLTLSGCTFELTNSASDVDVQVSGSGTIAEIISCEFSGASVGGATQGTGIVVTDDGVVNISGGVMHNYTTAIQVGDGDDTSSTALAASGLIIRNCTTDILQQNLASLLFDAGTASSSAIIINDATNVELAFFDLDDNGALTIGSTADEDTSLIQVDNDPTNHPGFNYKSSLYSAQAVGFENTFGSPSSVYSLSADNTGLVSITTDRTNSAGLRLVSDTNTPVGTTVALRGWDINKNASAAELSFTYQNSDTVGQAAVSPYIVMQLDGFNNLLQLPATGTQIVFGGDTNLYRSAANVLKTDDNFIVGTLTANRAVITNGSNQLASSAVTDTELGFLSGVTSSVQTQIDSKVAKAGDTMTGTLILPAGSAASPSLKFTGSTNTGLSAATANTLSLDTNGVERMNIDGSGNVTINGFGTTGIVHNSSAGLLTTSLIVDADVAAAAGIVDTKLAIISTAGKVANSATTATSANTVNTIVLRNASGNFSAGAISVTDEVISNSVTITPFSTAGVVHNDASGLLSSSLIVNADITNATIANAKLATISSSNTPGAIVVRDGSGNFATNMITIAGTVTNATDVATKDYVDSAVSTGLVAKTPAEAVSLTNQTLSGFPTVDGVSFPTGTDRILLTGQTDPVENGLWVTAAGAWSRPADFASGSTAGQAYVLILQGTLYGGSSWLCNTPTAIVDTNAIGFALFSLPNTTTGANVGAGTGLIFRDKTGSTLNFKSLIQGSHIVITNNTDDITLATDATSANTAGTIVARNGSGNFSAGAISMTDGIVSSSLTITPFSTAGIVHNNTSGLLSSSLIVNADVAAGANIADTKLDTIATAGKVSNSATTATSANTASAIVARDGSGNFSAGTITASLTGAASLNVLKAGDTMTGALIIPAGSAASPSLRFTGSTNTGFSAATANTLSFDTNGAERMNINSTGGVTINGLTSTGIVHNSAAGLLSTSLIVNADVDPAAAIVDTKLDTIATAGKVSNSATTATSANTASAIVARDGSGNFAAGTITASLTGAASLNVLKAGDTMTGALQLPAGTTAAPSLRFTGSTTSGFSASAGDLSFSTSAVERMKIASGGTISINAFTSTGIVHNDASGNLSSSLIVNADVAAGAAIVDTKLDVIATAGKVANSATTATSANTASTIVLRNASGNFSAGSVSFTDAVINNLTVANCITSACVTALSIADMSVTGTLSVQDEVLNGTLKITPFSTAGVVHNSAAGVLSSSLIINNDVAAGANIADTKLNTIATAGKVSNSATTATSANTASAIVARDGSGNFSAGTITASLTGAASLNVLKAGDTMTGALTVPAGSAASPSIKFTGSTNTGFSAATLNTLSFDTNGSERMNIDASGNVTINGLTSTGIVHNSAAGLLTTSLIVDADVAAGANIADTKLATISTAGKVANSATTATSANTANTIVLRNASGNFSASVISMTDGVASGNLVLTTNPSTSTAGNIMKDGNRFIHNFGTSNTFVGENAGNFTMTGTGLNTGIGASALTANTTGNNNVAVGYQALTANTTATNNTAIGSTALAANTSGNNNTAVGQGALATNATGIQNTAVGSGALAASTATGNTAVGYVALTANTTGTNNTAIGRSALTTNSTGTGNTAVGQGALRDNTANNNTAVGLNALATNTTGNTNVAVGQGALTANTTGVSNIAVGNNSLATNITGQLNTAVGHNALNANTADSNTALGARTLLVNTTGTQNVAVGRNALVANTIGSNNTAVGQGSLTANTTATDNTALGYQSLLSVTTGSTNIAIGSSAGGTLTTGSGNIYINANAGSAAEATTTRIGTSQTACYIQGIFGASTGSASLVAIDSTGKLGTATLTATNLNTPNTIVQRDSTGSFAAQVISAVDEVLSGNLVLSTNPSTSTAGNIMKGSNRFIHNFGTSNTFVGENAGNFTMSGSGLNTGIGVSSLTANTTGTQNTAVGHQTLTANTTGANNVAMGYQALTASTNGVQNTAIGVSALAASTGGVRNTAVGYQTLLVNNASDNVAIGYQALAATTVGNLVAIGSGALAANTTATNNTAVGFNALTTNTTGVSNTAVGNSALSANTVGNGNTAMGTNALQDNTIGNFLTGLGSSALANNTTGSSNTAVGNGAGNGITTGSRNTLIGDGSMFTGNGDDNATLGYHNMNVSSSGSRNVAIGSSTLGKNTTGNDCVGIGYQALFEETSGSGNVGIGASALKIITVGVNNTAIGNSSMSAATGLVNNDTAVGYESLLFDRTGSQVAVGYQALRANTTGAECTAVGYQALTSNTNALGNTAVGYQALTTNTTGAQNTAVGDSTLTAATTGTNNTAIGYNALMAVSSGNNNTAVGYNALAANAGATNNNTAVGSSALAANTIGTQNVAVGVSSLAANISGSRNTAIGYNTLLVSTTGADNTALGYNALAANINGTLNTAVGSGALAANTAGNNTAVGYNALTVNSTGTQNSALGSGALAANTTGANNTALGYNALAVSVTGTDNTAVGRNALAANAAGTNNNTAVGSSALAANTTGTQNTAVGKSALAANNVGTNNTAIGYNSLAANTTGTDNTAIGNNALAVNTIGINNTAVGSGSLDANTTGVQNSALGTNALGANTIGTNNTAIGYNALAAGTTGTDNTAVGNNALAASTTGTSNNTAVGSSALAANTTGTQNAALGKSALAGNTVGIHNTAVGFNALTASTTGTDNTAIGYNALAANATGTSNNTAVGSSALAGNTTGTQNSALGVSAAAAITTGSRNTAVGYNALLVSATGNDNTAIGYNALAANVTGISNNTAIGSNALAANTTGGSNTAVGSGAMATNITGPNNTAVGFNALNANTIGGQNTAVGRLALATNSTGAQNTAIGNNALTANTTGANNTALGSGALAGNTEGTANVAVGISALNVNTTGANNTAVGSSSLATNQTGTFNTALGQNALNANTGDSNTALGARTLLVNTTGINNTAVGRGALIANTIGSNNVSVGQASLAANTTATDNTALGFQSLPAVTTGSTNIAIGSGAGGTLTTGAGNIYINANAAAAAEATTTRIGTSQTACYIQGIYNQTYGATNAPVIVDNTGKLGTIVSTRRAKHNIEDMGDKSADILNLRPVTFAYNHDATETEQYGLIAEEVADIFPAIVMRDEDGTPATVQYHILPALMLNEMQKQHNELITHKAVIAQLQKLCSSFAQRLDALEMN